ncbi:hypothetical protein BCR33DRAFT_712120 [Rhizoclosmatium globosum]|uniref:Vacuolar protein sorting-associated protein n=1 Tax=Rhizoclosmatium globosum TaxID=329046 RepID=A0A1Y2CY60_9FUNG|nr:hypothetical protein BCR33DRAFT_712120 [Rhizoclosmatium globosum]|eukprot:ORY51917.1 hypothetical protein BCR33DRAFT_712120 [Rhizoclosmatium globosum]
MFESVISLLLNKFLGDYVLDLENNQLSIGIWAGDVVLQNLRLKREALDKFNLPVDVVEGFLGHLTISIPWSDLKTKPVRVFIKDLYLVVNPKSETEYDEGLELERAHKAKMDRVEAAELLSAKEKLPEDKQNTTFITQLITKIVDNLQISIQNIHIRYEDRSLGGADGAPLSIGITLSELSAASTDENWHEAFIHDEIGVIHKLIRLGSLAIYFNNNEISVSSMTPEQMKSKLMDLIADDDIPVDNDYILKPVSGQGKVKINKSPKKGDIKYDGSLEFDEFGFVISDEQYASILMLTRSFALFVKSQKYRRFRPPKYIRPMMDPRLWLNFAVKCVVSDIHEKNEKWSWKYFEERRDRRLLYVSLFKRSKSIIGLPPEDLELLKTIEKRLSFEDIRFYRSIANNQLKKERAILAATTPTKPAETTTVGWIASWWGATEQPAVDASVGKLVEATSFTDDQMKKLMDTIEYDPEASLIAADTPNDTVLMHVEWSLRKGSLALKKKNMAGDFVSVVFDNFTAKINHYPSSVTGNISLGGMTVADGTTPGTLYPFLIQAIQDKGIPSQGFEKQPFFSLDFEHNPLDERADEAITLKMLPLQVVLNPLAINGVIDFLAVPSSESYAITAIKSVAQGITAQTRAGLEFALSKHRTLDAKIDIAAPIFVLPESCTSKKTTVVVIDAGHLNVESKLVDKEAKKELEARQGGEFSPAEMEKLFSMMYDKFKCVLTSVQVVIGPSLESCLIEVSGADGSSSLHFLDRADITFEVKLSILPKLANHVRTIISGKLPRLHMNISDRKYKSFMKVLDIVTRRSQITPSLNPSAKAEWTDSHQSDLLVPVDDDDESFFDAEEDIDRPPSQLGSENPDTVLFKFDFEIGQVSASLKKSDVDPTKISRTLADLKISEFKINYQQRPLDYKVDIQIRSVSIEDQLNNTSNVRFLLSPTVSDSTSIENLLTIQYHSRKPMYTHHDGVDQNVRVSLASVDVNLVKESVLYLYDFVLYTFTTVEASRVADALLQGEPIPTAPITPVVASTVMVVNVDFSSCNFLINQNNTQIATASFGALHLVVTFKQGRMLISGRLGNLSIIDNVLRQTTGRISRHLLTIEGSEVADFDYETFNSNLPGYPGYDSFLRFHAASARLTFFSPLLHELSSFLNEFFKMHMIMDAARKAVEYQEVTGKMRYDLDIASPIIEFPDTQFVSDKSILMYLGKISARNEFKICHDGSNSSSVVASILAMKLVSNFPVNNKDNYVAMMDDVNIQVGCDFVKIAEESESLVPLSQIRVDSNDIKVKLNTHQYKFAIDILNSLSKFMSGPKAASPSTNRSTESDGVGLVSKISTSTNLVPDVISDMFVNIPSITLEICDEDLQSGSSSQDKSIAQFVINGLAYQTMTNSWQESETEIHVRCLNIFDTRKDGDNLFREIMPSLVRDHDQFCLKIKRNKLGASDFVAALDTFKFILVMDHLFLVRKFLLSPFAGAKQEDPNPDKDGLIDRIYSFDSLDMFKYRINIVDVEVILLQDPKIRDSEAILLLGHELVISYDLVTTLSSKDMGMFFCVMNNRKDTTLRFIQNFDLTLVMDSRLPSPGHQLTAINVDVSPLMLRVSFRDLYLITDIFNKAVSLSGGSPDETSQAPSTKTPRQTIVMAREKIQVTTQGIRVVIIDDLNDLQLPMYDFVVDKLFFEVSDWSTAMRVDTGLKLHVNNFNVKNSHWEPLVEGFEFYLNVSREDDRLSVDIYAQKKLEVNISHVFVESTLNTLALLKKQQQLKERPSRTSGSAPYILRNKTGYDMTLWIESVGDGLDTVLQELRNNDEIPWRFDDWRVMRENVSPTPNKLSIQMHGQEWETLKAIPVDREGTRTYILRPSVNRIAHRLVCEVRMRKNIKIVTFRSTTVIQNSTGIYVDVMVVNTKGQMTSVYALAPGNECCVPIEASYTDRIFVRPQENFGYNWSTEVLYWRDLSQTMQGPSLIACTSLDKSTAPFVFQINVSHPYETTVSSYPFLTMTLLPPFQLENLLPYDFRYVVYDKDSRQEHRGTLVKGAVDPIHTINPTHSLLLSIEIVGVDFKPSEVAILSNADLSYRDETLTLKDVDDLELQLRIKYSDNLEYGGRKVSIYSPYVLLNRTGLDIFYNARSLIATTRPAAGQSSTQREQAAPFMFSYSNFEPLRNRAQVRVANSDWSKPLSFEAVGSSFDLLVPASRGQEVHLGVRVHEGEGKFFLTKVVTFTPRFMIRNNMTEDLHCRQESKQSPILIPSKASVPLHYFMERSQRQLSLRMAGLMDEWSSPFNIDQVGITYVKLGRMGTTDEDLIRAEVILENATLFIIFSREEGRWPIRVENNSDATVFFWQQNSKNRYEVAPGQSRQYSWDNPSLLSKSVVLNINGKERLIDVREIGHLVPLKYPTPDGTGRGGTMSIQVYAEGPTLVISLGNYNESNSVYKRLSTVRGSTSASGDEGFQKLNKEVKEHMTVQIRLEGIGISVIDRQVKELLYASAKNIEFAYVDTSMAQSITFSINWLQIDNQRYGSLDPIFLYPSVLPKEGEESFHPVLMASLSKSKDSSYGVDFYNWFTILLQEISIDLDEDFLYALINFAKFEVIGWEQEDVPMFDSMIIPEPKQTDGETRMYFEKFFLQPVQFNISFQRTQGGNVDVSSRESRNILTFLFDVFTMTVGNIHDAPIRLNALEIYHPIVTLSSLVDLMMKFYSQEIVGQLHKIIGSADFLGNPVGLFSNVGSGVKDFFYEPIQGFEITRPQDFGIGLAKGTSSLVKKTVYGLTDTLSKFTGSVSKGLSVITLDEEYQQKRRMASARNRPRHLGVGVTTGVTSLGTSVASGLTGVLSKPIEGYSKDGAVGFFKGLGKGLVGVVSKPAIGVFDLATNVAEGIRNTTTVFDKELEKIRLPRFVSKDGILTPYDSREALGLKMLKSLENGKYFKEDYFAHLELRIDDLVVFVTNNRVMLGKVRASKVDWEILYDDLQLVRIDNGGITLIKKGGQQARARVIPCPDQASAQWLLNRIERMFGAYTRIEN